jgi:hypothetical protein
VFGCKTGRHASYCISYARSPNFCSELMQLTARNRARQVSATAAEAAYVQAKAEASALAQALSAAALAAEATFANANPNTARAVLHYRSIAAAAAAPAPAAPAPADAGAYSQAVVPLVACTCPDDPWRALCPARLQPLPRERLPSLYESLGDAAKVAHRAFAAQDPSRISLSCSKCASSHMSDHNMWSDVPRCIHNLGWELAATSGGGNTPCSQWRRRMTFVPLGELNPDTWRVFDARGGFGTPVFETRQCAEAHLIPSDEWTDAETAGESKAHAGVRSHLRIPCLLDELVREREAYARDYKLGFERVVGALFGRGSALPLSWPLDVQFSCHLSYMRLFHKRNLHEKRPDTRGRELVSLLMGTVMGRSVSNFSILAGVYPARLEGGATYALERLTQEERDLMLDTLAADVAHPAVPGAIGLANKLRTDMGLRDLRAFRHSGMETLMQTNGGVAVYDFVEGLPVGRNVLRMPLGGAGVASIIASMLSGHDIKSSMMLSRYAVAKAAAAAAGPAGCAASAPRAPASAAAPAAAAASAPTAHDDDVQIATRPRIGLSSPETAFLAPSSPHFCCIMTNRTERDRGIDLHRGLPFGLARPIECPVEWSDAWMRHALAEVTARVIREIESDPATAGDDDARARVLTAFVRPAVADRMRNECLNQWHDRRLGLASMRLGMGITQFKAVCSYTTMSPADDKDAIASETAWYASAEGARTVAAIFAAQATAAVQGADAACKAATKIAAASKARAVAAAKVAAAAEAEADATERAALEATRASESVNSYAAEATAAHSAAVAAHEDAASTVVHQNRTATAAAATAERCAVGATKALAHARAAKDETAAAGPVHKKRRRHY